jgi:hypothetical protein
MPDVEQKAQAAAQAARSGSFWSKLESNLHFYCAFCCDEAKVAYAEKGQDISKTGA